MSNAVFPVLPGLKWDVIKAPEWLTKVHRSVGAKEQRAAFWSRPIYRWTLSYELLRASATAELQTLLGFFNARQGMFDSFLYSDPTDNNVTAHGFGVGDGVTTAFQLQRTLAGPRRPNGWDPISYPVYTSPRTNACLWSRDMTNAAWTKAGTGTVALNAPGLDGTANSATTLTDNDAANFYAASQAVSVGNNSNSHAIAAWFAKDAVTSRFPQLKATLSGGTSVIRGISINTQTGALGLNNIVGGGSQRVIDAGLWWVLEIVVANNASGNTALTWAIFPSSGTVFGADSAAATGSAVVGQVNVELNRNAYTAPIFTTSAAVTVNPAYYPAIGDGFEPVFDLDYSAVAPQIFVNGVLQTPGAGHDYSLSSTGLVTFLAIIQPAGAVLTWTGNYYQRVRFDLDAAEFNNFLTQLWEAKKITFVTAKAP